jgi:hypothetical protein
MAKDDERRKKFWEDEEDEDDGWARPAVGKPGSAGSDRLLGSLDIDQKISEARVLMDQTHQLYLQYFGGIEKRTPIEKVKLLESKIAELQRLQSPLPTARFKISQFISQFNTMKELWERKLRERERK